MPISRKFLAMMPEDVRGPMIEAWALALAWAIGTPEVLQVFFMETGFPVPPGEKVAEDEHDALIAQFIPWFNATIWNHGGQKSEVTFIN